LTGRNLKTQAPNPKQGERKKTGKLQTAAVRGFSSLNFAFVVWDLELEF
jgi:hypothetical protein